MVRLIQPDECDCKTCDGGAPVPKGTYGGSHCLCLCHYKQLVTNTPKGAESAEDRAKEMAIDVLSNALKMGPPECELEAYFLSQIREAETQAFEQGFNARVKNMKAKWFKEAIEKAAAVLRGKCDQYHCGHEDCNRARAIEKLTPDGGSEK